MINYPLNITIMKRLFLCSFILTFCLTAALAQLSDERNVGSFNRIKTGGSFDIFVQPGNNEKIRIEAREGPIDKIETEVKGNTLHIYMEDNWWKNYTFKDVNIYITVRKLEAVESSGSGNVRVQTTIEGNDVRVASSGSGNLICEKAIHSNDDLVISNSGSGDCKIRSSANTEDNLKISNSGSGNMDIDEITADVLDVQNSGSGGLEVYGGRVNHQSIVMSGSGNLDLGNVQSEICRISKSGSGNVHVSVRDELSGNSSGSGNIYLKGTTARTNVNTSGSGKIKTN